VAYPRISFNEILEGDDNMDYKIIEKPAFDVIAKAKNLPLLWVKTSSKSRSSGMNSGAPVTL